MNLLDGLFAYWLLNEANGTRADRTGANPLAEHGTVGQVAGLVGEAASFPGTITDYLETDPATLSLADGFTIAGWCKQSVGAISTIAACFNPNAEPFWVGTDDASPPNVQIFVSADDGTFAFFGTPGPAVGSGFFFAARYAGPTKTAYLQVDNGPVVSAVNGSGIATDTLGQAILLGNDGTSGLNGWEQRCGLWLRPLTQGEITLLYNDGRGWDYPFDPRGHAHGHDGRHGAASASDVRVGTAAPTDALHGAGSASDAARGGAAASDAERGGAMGSDGL